MSEETKTNGDEKDLQIVETFIRSKGAQGVTAVQIVEHLGLPMTDRDKKSSLFKARRLARKIVDNKGGKRTEKVGKNKVYSLS